MKLLAKLGLALFTGFSPLATQEVYSQPMGIGAGMLGAVQASKEEIENALDIVISYMKDAKIEDALAWTDKIKKGFPETSYYKRAVFLETVTRYSEVSSYSIIAGAYFSGSGKALPDDNPFADHTKSDFIRKIGEYKVKLKPSVYKLIACLNELESYDDEIFSDEIEELKKWFSFNLFEFSTSMLSSGMWLDKDEIGKLEKEIFKASIKEMVFFYENKTEFYYQLAKVFDFVSILFNPNFSSFTKTQPDSVLNKKCLDLAKWYYRRVLNLTKDKPFSKRRYEAEKKLRELEEK